MKKNKHKKSTGPRSNHGNITLGTSRKHSFGAHLGSFGPLEASGGQTRQTTVGTKVAQGKLEQFGSVFWYLGVVKVLPTATKFKKNNKHSQKKPVFDFIVFFCSSSQSPHRHRHEEHVMLQTRGRRRTVPQARSVLSAYRQLA